MKKLICALLAVTMLGCAEKAEKNEELTAEGITERLQAYLPEDREEQDAEIVRNMLGLDEEGIVGVHAYAGTEENQQILYVVETETEEEALAAAEKLEYYVGSLRNMARMYDPEQLAMIDQAEVWTSGNYAVLVICEDIGEAKKEIAEMLWEK